MNLIAIETSTSWLSLAVSHGGAIVSRHIFAEQRHAEIALDELRSLLQEAGLAMADVEGVAFGEGPGAFTGLRVGIATAKGLAHALRLPIAGVGTGNALLAAGGAAAGGQPKGEDQPQPLPSRAMGVAGEGETHHRLLRDRRAMIRA